MKEKLSDEALAQLFTEARSHNGFLPDPVPDKTLHALYDLLKWGPTAANGCPARFVFVKSPQAKAQLKEALDPGNIAKTMQAPVTVIIGYDLAFYENLPRLFPHTDARSWFVGNEALIHETAFRDAALQGAYLILAARALGLDCGPMGGFNRQRVDATFFAGTTIRSLFLVNLGVGDPSKLFPRHPRLSFEEACKIV
jgi:3-hydroxypropanoate dehydrogenase